MAFLVLSNTSSLTSSDYMDGPIGSSWFSMWGRVHSIGWVWHDSAELYPLRHLPRQDQYQIQYNAWTRLGINLTRLTHMSFRVNSVDSVRLQRILKIFIKLKKKKNQNCPFKSKHLFWNFKPSMRRLKKMKKKNQNHNPFKNKWRNHWRMRAWFRISLHDFPQNRALSEGGDLVSAVVTCQVDWIYHRWHRQDNPFIVRLLPFPC